MPQMAPINWTLLMMMFILIILTFLALNHYSFNYNVKSKFTKKIKSNKINWKW